MTDEYEIVLIAEYDDEKQRMDEKEAKAACKAKGAVIIDANHYANPKIIIPSKYLPCFVRDNEGSLWRGYDYYGDGGRCFIVGDGLDGRGGVVGMRKKAPHKHKFEKQPDKCKCGEVR